MRLLMSGAGVLPNAFGSVGACAVGGRVSGRCCVLSGELLGGALEQVLLPTGRPSGGGGDHFVEAGVQGADRMKPGGAGQARRTSASTRAQCSGPETGVAWSPPGDAARRRR